MVATVVKDGFHIDHLVASQDAAFHGFPNSLVDGLNEFLGNRTANNVVDKFVSSTRHLGLEAKRTLLVLGEADPNVVRSCRNLRNLKTTLASQINPYELLQSEALLVTAPALALMKEIFSR